MFTDAETAQILASLEPATTPADDNDGRSPVYAVSAKTGLPELVWLPKPPPVALPQPIPAPPPVVVQAPARDPWPARMLTGGAAIAGVAAAVGHFAAELGQAAHAAEIAGIGVGAAAAGIWLLKGTAPKVTVNISNSVTGSSSSANSSSTSDSRASVWGRK
jgi:hypothetical protein